MIEKKDLRIGNWAKYWSGQMIDQIQELKYCVIIGHEKVEYEDLEPIPLTVEILEKCGLKDRGPLEGELTVEVSGDIICQTEATQIFRFYLKPFKTKIKYLHQLQNIFYDLTGKELNVNL